MHRSLGFGPGDPRALAESGKNHNRERPTSSRSTSGLLLQDHGGLPRLSTESATGRMVCRKRGLEWLDICKIQAVSSLALPGQWPWSGRAAEKGLHCSGRFPRTATFSVSQTADLPWPWERRCYWGLFPLSRKIMGHAQNSD